MTDMLQPMNITFIILMGAMVLMIVRILIDFFKNNRNDKPGTNSGHQGHNQSNT